MNALPVFHPFDLLLAPEMRERLAEKASSVERAMRQRFGADFAEADVSLVYIHYLFGAVMAAVPDAGAREKIDLLRNVAERSLSPEAVTKALNTAPAADNPVLTRMLDVAEGLGRRDAETICLGSPAGTGPAGGLRNQESEA